MDAYNTGRERADFAEMVNDMMALLPGANPAYVRRMLHHRLRELCEETWCWSVTTPRVDVKAGERFYVIPLVHETRVLFVHTVFLRGRALGEREFEARIEDADAPHVRLRNAPVMDEERGIWFHVALSPFPRCEDFSDGLIVRLWDTLEAGVLMEMMAEEGRPYFKPQKAAEYARTWNEGVYECNARRRVGDSARDVSGLNTSWIPGF